MAYKFEGGGLGDHDFYLIIADPSDLSQTLIVEMPDPECSNVCASTQVARIAKARQAFAEKFHPDIEFRTLDVPVSVTVTGIGFFDFFHNQRGYSSNGMELHPVLDFEIGH
jgi:hypothetical protein